MPTATAVAPAARKASASAPDSIPPMPITGIDDRGRDPRTWSSATARTAGPERPPLPAPSQASSVRGSSRGGPQRVDQRDRVGAALLGRQRRPPPARRRSASASRSAASRSAGARPRAAPASPSGCSPTISPDLTLGQETFSSSAATSARAADALDQPRELVVAGRPSPRRSAAPAARRARGRSCSRKPSSPLFGRPIELIIPAGVSQSRGGGLPARGSGVIVFETNAENGKSSSEGRRRRRAGRRSRRRCREPLSTGCASRSPQSSTLRSIGQCPDPGDQRGLDLAPRSTTGPSTQSRM